MKIGSISILLIPSQDEIDKLNATKIALHRNEDRLWSVSNQEGLLPYQVRLANELQELISKFNGGNQ